MASIYKETMDLQTRLDNLSIIDVDKHLVARLSLAAINRCWNASNARAAHASNAYFIDDGLTSTPFAEPTQKFGEIVLKGHVPRVTCVEVSGRLVVALPFFDATVLGPAQEIEPELLDYELEDYNTVLPLDTPISRPLYTPVENLGFIMLAA